MLAKAAEFPYVLYGAHLVLQILLVYNLYRSMLIYQINTRVKLKIIRQIVKLM